MQPLPVFESVKDALGYTMSNITLLVKASMFWVAIYTILVGIFDFVDGQAYLQAIANFAEAPTADASDPLRPLWDLMDNLGAFGAVTNWLYFAMMVLGVIAYYSIAIAWHRACLLDEVPPLARLGALEFKYFGYTILLVFVLSLLSFIISFVVSLGISLLADGSSGQNTELGVFILIIGISFGSFLLFGRFSLVFPGIAVRDRRMNFRTSWAATVNNTWRILGGTILCVIPSLVITLIISLLASLSLPLVIILPISMVLQLLSGAFLLSFMSICYQFLVPSPDEGDLA